MSNHHTLYLFHCGKLFETDENDGARYLPVPSYLIVSASGKRYLIDTGNPRVLIGATDCQPWYPARCEITPADDPIARLAELGYAPGDVDAIIATHFDFDHAGRYDAFASLGTDVWVQRAQMGSALTNPDRYDAGLWNMPGLRWRLVDGDFEIEPGITLLRTDGHAMGHQSILVETDSGWVILAADAIDNSGFIDTRSFPDYFDDIDATNRSIDRLLAIAGERDAVIVFGHDSEQWETLPRGPAPYQRS